MSLAGTMQAPEVAASARRSGFRGPIRLPGDEGYDAARATWAGGLEQYPAVVAEALDAADVRAAVLAARTHRMPLAVQSTGHGTYVECDGGLLLRTSRMNQVHVDPERRIVRVGAGAIWGQVIAAAEPYGLAPPSGSHAAVGVAGYTLGGGTGWLARKHGFGADNLVRAELVTADGKIVTASAGERPELFWALRGAGRNFGVVTELEIRLAPVATVYGGTASYHPGRTRALLAAFRDLAPQHPAEITVNAVIARDRVGLRAVYLGDAEAGRRALAPLLAAVGEPVEQDFREMRYAETEAIGGTAPRQFELFAALPEDVIATAIRTVATGGADEIEVRHWGGATTRALGNGPVGHRHVPFSMTIAGTAAGAAPLAARATGGSFLNFLHDAGETERAYTRADLARLRELKRRYDPENRLGSTHNIGPADALPIAA